jgi:hypothetical protein
MKRSSIALTLGALLVATGCGGKSSTTSTSAKSPARKEACVFALEARGNYRHALVELGLRFFNKKRDEAALAAVRQFQGQLQRVIDMSSGTQKAQLEKLKAALAQHERLLLAFSAHNLAAAKRESAGLDAALNESLPAFERICRQA